MVLTHRWSPASQYDRPMAYTRCFNRFFTTKMLGSIIDHWAEVLENNRPDSPFTTQRLADATVASDDTVGTDPNVPPFKYFILSIGFELKKVLPAEDVQWLFLRARSRRYKKDVWMQK
ncbi:hypothetical protein HO173_002302 [Letharia columbiana]|uniref:Uncharacterized protein n=1 Tax=Letharia columbiana TaxID=112416 RepID=A0A8H6G3B9_9LECA|nr:uncharacterized protein HO173_002302 [Letharia columbiana]KAF6239756.1 hypothetical protein HO173_002302 [Letharia columbiana]